MFILGISAYYHDSAAALISDGNILAAAQEERFTRIKHDNSFPLNSIKACLKIANININQIDYFCFYEKPFLKFDRLLETYISYVPFGFKSFRKALPLWIKEKLFQKKNLISEIKNLGFSEKIEDKILFSEHHLSHASSAFFASPYKDAAVLTLDGVGEWASTTLSIGNGNNLEIIKEIHFPHSLGLLYSAFTYHLGFKVNSGEYKVMGLAPYGTPKYKNKITENLIDIKSDGSFRLNLEYFNYCVGLTMTNAKFDELFGFPMRKSGMEITKNHMDMAASIQSVVEEIILLMAATIKKETRKKNLCLAGGVALNCVANGKILKNKIFDNIWIQPAAGDAGGALGAALMVWYKHLGNQRANKKNNIDEMQGSLLGPQFSNLEISNKLTNVGAVYEHLSEENLINKTVNSLIDGKVIGWFQGRMEFGPRALGARSILADPRSSTIQKELNLKIKFRESFRPFAPSVLKTHAKDWFELESASPYMLLVANVKKSKLKKTQKNKNSALGFNRLDQIRSEIPAVTHVDNSARIQTITEDTNPIYYKLILSFYKATGCPLLVNTSFNIRGEPIVCSPEQAFRCLMGTNMDMLIIGNMALNKGDQNTKLRKDYRKDFELD